ncbi:hypothetical protein ABEW05_003328 [Botrytis cinerea]
MEMTNTPEQQDLEIRKPMAPYELREKMRLEMKRKSQEDAKSRQSQAESNNIPVVQEQNPDEAGKSLVKDGPVTQDYEKNEFKSANEPKDTSDDMSELIERVSKVTIEPAVREKTLEKIWTEVTKNPKMARYRSLDITPGASWFESTLRNVNILLRKVTDEERLSGRDENLAAKRRDDILTTLIEAALELSSTILDAPEISGKPAAQHNFQNKDHRNAVISIEPPTNNPTADENPIAPPTRRENCPDSVVPFQDVEILKEPSQESRNRSVWFEYHPKGKNLFYTIDLYERVHTFCLDKYGGKPSWKTVARLYVPIKSPPRIRRLPNFDASKVHIVNAISGWKSDMPETSCSNGFIPNKTWTEKVQEMCQVIGYELKTEIWDEDKNPRSYNACHAEKQVLAYWLYNFALSTPSSNRCAIWERRDEPIRPEYYEGLYIVVSKPLCDCCVEFMNYVAAYYKISFTIHSPAKVTKFHSN